MRVGAVCETTGSNYAKKSHGILNGWVKVNCNGWMHVTESLWSQWKPLQAKREKDKQFYSVVTDLNCRKTEKSSQTKLATGPCKNWIFVAVDNFPPCIPVTIFPQYQVPVAGQTRGSSIWPVLFVQLLLNMWRLFLKFSQSVTWWGWRQVSSLI